MGKRRRSVASDATNDSDGESGCQPRVKRPCDDKWSFPEELKNSVRCDFELQSFQFWCALIRLFLLTRARERAHTDSSVPKAIWVPSQGKGCGESTALWVPGSSAFSSFPPTVLRGYQVPHWPNEDTGVILFHMPTHSYIPNPLPPLIHSLTPSPHSLIHPQPPPPTHSLPNPLPPLTHTSPTPSPHSFTP